VTHHDKISGAGLMRRYVQLLQYFRPERIVERYWRTHDTVSPEAAWHAFLWNRVWSNYGLRSGVFRQSPLASTYPADVRRAVPDRPVKPSLPLDTIATFQPSLREDSSRR
jgi:hypothetical protein